MWANAFLIILIIAILTLMCRAACVKPAPPLAEPVYGGLLYVENRRLKKKTDMLINYMGTPACVPMRNPNGRAIPESDLDIAAYMISQNS